MKAELEHAGFHGPKFEIYLDGARRELEGEQLVISFGVTAKDLPEADAISESELTRAIRKFSAGGAGELRTIRPDLNGN